jgi:DNA polymerase-3 subunit delta'
MDFNAVIGHDTLKQQLKSLIENQRVSHALMFTGNEGSGNLAMALAFANELLIQSSADPSATQVKTSKLIHPDLHFCYPVNSTPKITGTKILSADFASEWREFLTANPYGTLTDWMEKLGIVNKQGRINVHQAAEVLNDLKLKPYESEFKIMLVWLPEKMGIEAANKLLKILEEPPQKTIFLLVSQQPEQLLATIISRVQMVRLKPISAPELSNAIVARHGLSADEANNIARISQGNYREAQRLINHNELRAFNQEMFTKWMRFLWQKEFLELMQWSETMAKQGREKLGVFFKYGLHVFRESLMMNYGSEEIGLTGGGEKNFITKFSPYVNELNAIDMISLFEEAAYHIERNGNPKIIIMDVSLKMMKLVRKKVKA